MPKILETLTPRLSEIAKIKIGGLGGKRTSAKGNEYRVPDKRSYFTITGTERDSAGDLKPLDAVMASLLEKYGTDCDEPIRGADGKTTDKTKRVRRLHELPIALLSDDIEEVLLASYCWYEGGIQATCDGETCTWYRDREGKPIPGGKKASCNGEHEKMVDSNGKRRFKLNAKFLCVLAEGTCSWGGVYVFRTTSKISLEQLYGTLQHIRGLTGGFLAGVPLRLVMRGVEVHPDGKATTVYVVHCELRGADLNAVQQQALQMAQMRIRNGRELAEVGKQYRALLSAPGENEDPEEQVEVEAEFYPETAAQAAAAPQAQPAASATVEVARTESKETTPSGRKVTMVDIEDALVEKEAAPAPAAAPAPEPSKVENKVEAAKTRGRKAAGKEPVQQPTSSSAAPIAPPIGPKAPPPVAPPVADDDLDSIPF